MNNDEEYHWLSLSEGRSAKGGKNTFPPFPDGFLVGPENIEAEHILQWLLEGVPRILIPDHDSRSGALHRLIPLGNIPDFLPILFIGGTGSGKSALLLGLVNGFRLLRPKSLVIYRTGAELLHEWTLSVQREETKRFRSQFDKADLIVIDGLDELKSHATAQEELTVLLESCRAKKIPILFALLERPELLRDFSESLIARLLAGLSVTIQPPSEGTRYRLIEKALVLLGQQPSPESIEWIVKTFPKTVAPLCGAIKRIVYDFCRDGRPLTLLHIQQYLDLDSKKKDWSLDSLARACASFYSIKLSELKGKSRSKTAVRARNMTIYLARTQTELTLQEIGAWLSGRNHTTILHSYHEIESLLENEPGLRESLEKILSQ